jgi:hypothetical protein
LQTTEIPRFFASGENRSHMLANQMCFA